MSAPSSNRLLTIGEFAAATQLSPKALRLYDEQQLLQPARIDSASGYRYYRSDQVAKGRLIRTLRDMDLPLAEVARVVATDGVRAEALLRQFANNLDQRYAREKRAYQTALLLLRDTTRAERPEIDERTRPAMTVIVRPFVTDRRYFYERLRSEVNAAESALRQLRLSSTGESYCRLLEPLSDEDAPVELLLPVDATGQFPEEITFRQLPAAPYAAIQAQGPDFSGPADALFDWFDRHGHRAIDTPWLRRIAGDADVRTEIVWAFEPANAAR